MTLKYILMDVEGTTTAKSFVYDTLFPYAKEEMKNFLFVNRDNSAVIAELDSMAIMLGFKSFGPEFNLEKALPILIQWMDEDKKIAPLKNLQGMIWENGYKSGVIKGHVYSEVKEAFLRWKDQKMLLGIYSSGSVLAQKLLFTNSLSGDLSIFLDDHFDTQVGAKQISQSYQSIAAKLKLETMEILFLSDRKEEIIAGQKAGMQVALITRKEEVGQEDNIKNDFSWPCYENFLEIKFLD